ncbi:MAG: hypothetical protein ACE5IW_12980 [bacterium]
MRAFEFRTKTLDNGELVIPQEIKKILKNGKYVRVILLFEEEESDWKRLTQEAFLLGYSEKDSAYDEL